eukprot:SAG31_NODE_4860_length_2902_cov_1.736354_1_plen_855_part_00
MIFLKMYTATLEELSGYSCKFKFSIVRIFSMCKWSCADGECMLHAQQVLTQVTAPLMEMSSHTYQRTRREGIITALAGAATPRPVVPPLGLVDARHQVAVAVMLAAAAAAAALLLAEAPAAQAQVFPSRPAFANWPACDIATLQAHVDALDAACPQPASEGEGAGRAGPATSPSDSAMGVHMQCSMECVGVLLPLQDECGGLLNELFDGDDDRYDGEYKPLTYLTNACNEIPCAELLRWLKALQAEGRCPDSALDGVAATTVAAPICEDVWGERCVAMLDSGLMTCEVDFCNTAASAAGSCHNSGLCDRSCGFCHSGHYRHRQLQILPLGRCDPAAFVDRVHAVERACCSDGCPDGVPTECDAKCAVVYTDFYSECQHQLEASLGHERFGAYERLFSTCNDDLPTEPLLHAVALCSASEAVEPEPEPEPETQPETQPELPTSVLPCNGVLAPGGTCYDRCIDSDTGADCLMSMNGHGRSMDDQRPTPDNGENFPVRTEQGTLMFNFDAMCNDEGHPADDRQDCYTMAMIRSYQLGNFGVSNFSIQLTYRGLGGDISPDGDHAVLFSRRSHEGPFWPIGPLALIYDDGGILFSVRNGTEWTIAADDCPTAVDPASVDSHVLRFERSGTTIGVYVDGLLQCSKVTPPWNNAWNVPYVFTHMNFGSNQQDAKLEQLNAQLSTIQLATPPTPCLTVPNPCYYNGHAVCNEDGSYTCTCRPGCPGGGDPWWEQPPCYHGDRCEFPCCTSLWVGDCSSCGGSCWGNRFAASSCLPASGACAGATGRGTIMWDGDVVTGPFDWCDATVPGWDRYRGHTGEPGVDTMYGPTELNYPICHHGDYADGGVLEQHCADVPCDRTC